MEPAAKQRRTHALAGLGRFRGVSANTVDEILNRLKAAPELLDAKTAGAASYKAAVNSTLPFKIR